MRGLILLILAIILSAVLLPVGFLYGITKRLINAVDAYLFLIAKSIDQHANVVCDELFNDTLIKRSGYKFGNEDRTISHVIAVNKFAGTLSRLGVWLEKLIDTIDKDHSAKSIGQ